MVAASGTFSGGFMPKPIAPAVIALLLATASARADTQAAPSWLKADPASRRAEVDVVAASESRPFDSLGRRAAPARLDRYVRVPRTRFVPDHLLPFFEVVAVGAWRVGSPSIGS